MKTFKVVDMHDDFTCSCGNQSHLAGFYPCNEEGIYVEPDHSWQGYYKCDDCKQIYLPA